MAQTKNVSAVAIASNSPTAATESVSSTSNKQVSSTPPISNKIGISSNSKQPPVVIDPKTQMMTRIGSIGRTTIACITPAGAVSTGSKNPLNNGSVDAASAAALAAAGVELDTIDDTMTEVIVKIENPDSSSFNGDELVCNAAAEDDNTFDYDLKLTSPVSWSYDCVKIEGEEFEDVGSADMENMEDDDDLLTTAAATTKLAEQSNEANAKQNKNIADKSNTSVRKIVLSAQQHQQLLEQQQHLQHLQLQPTHQALQIKLPAIPATITTIAAPKFDSAGNVTASSSSSASNLMAIKTVGNEQSAPMNNIDYQTSLSDDKRYRILIQNQRMRKESLEHSDDMIYNADIEKPWVCRNCNRTYKWKNSLKCHLKNECGLPPRYFCNKMCGYATNVHSNLKRHLNTKCRDREKEEEKKQSANTYTLVFQKE